MTNEQAIAIIRKEYLCVNRDCDIERNCGKCDLMMPSKEPILEAYKMAIKALEQEPKTGHWIKTRDCYGNHHFTCSECGNDIATQNADNWNDKYCSECGAKMVEPQERSENEKNAL